MPISDGPDRSSGRLLVRGLSWACAALVALRLVLPIVMQALALHATRQLPSPNFSLPFPRSTRCAAASTPMTPDATSWFGKRSERATSLQILATITRILPDDTFLTDFALRDRQMTLSGRSASAPRLITGLSSDPAIRNTAFAAPVTRIEGATMDIFSIKAEIAP